MTALYVGGSFSCEIEAVDFIIDSVAVLAAVSLACWLENEVDRF